MIFYRISTIGEVRGDENQLQKSSEVCAFSGWGVQTALESPEIQETRKRNGGSCGF
jgi:hypothetical protein